MYGNRDGIVEGSTEYNTFTPNATATAYYAESYSYDEETGRFTLVNPVGVLGSDLSEEYIGWYTMRSTVAHQSSSSVYKVTSVSVSTNITVGYAFVTYGTTSMEKAQTNTNDSDIKAYLDDWYEKHLSETEYEQYIADTLFCNDRSLYYTRPSGYSNLGHGVEQTVYRWYMYSSNSRVKLSCAQQNDRFTVTDEVTGNGDLSYPIGLVTKDEVYLAGGYASSDNNSGYYSYTGNDYWTMSPSYFNGASARVNFIKANGSANINFSVISSYGVRPVINLKAASLKLGDGSAGNPYIVEG